MIKRHKNKLYEIKVYIGLKSFVPMKIVLNQKYKIVSIVNNFDPMKIESNNNMRHKNIVYVE